MQFNLQSNIVQSHKPGLDLQTKRFVPMTYLRFSSEDAPVCKGLVTKWSEDGLNFRSQHLLKLGQTVFIRIDPDQMLRIEDKGMEGCLKSMCLAEIYRCCKNDDPPFGGYSVSARYLTPCY